MGKGTPAYQISEETKHRTKECLHSFACMNNEAWNTCAIDSAINGILIIKNQCNKKDCAYSVLLGYSYCFCKCPVRYEIYQRYNK
jgi:hypothetical protein